MSSATPETDFTYTCGEYPRHEPVGLMPTNPAISIIGEPGHVHTFPNEGTANGTVVFQPGDIIILPYCRYVQDPVRLDIRDGFVTKIEAAWTRN